MRWRDRFGVVKEAAVAWANSRTFAMGAALAYYAVFSIAPLLVITVAVAGMVFGEEAAQSRLVAELQQFLSPLVARAVAETLGYAHLTHSGALATLIGAGVLLFGAVGVFTQLQSSLNAIWGVKTRPGLSLWAAVRVRLRSFLLVGLMGALLLASLVASTALAAVSGYLPEAELPGGFSLLEGLHWVVSLALLTLLFALLYKLLPDVRFAWRVVWAGAAATAVLFSVGNYLIGLYLGRSSVASAYGAAGSLVVLLVWVYYSSQVLLFGAELTEAYARRSGEPARPAAHAVWAEPARDAR
jgi:membrane protein